MDAGTDRVYQYDGGVFWAGGGVPRSASSSFPLAAGNTNPQGIADPPVAEAISTMATASPATLDSPVLVLAAYCSEDHWQPSAGLHPRRSEQRALSNHHDQVRLALFQFAVAQLLHQPSGVPADDHDESGRKPVASEELTLPGDYEATIELIAGEIRAIRFDRRFD